MKTAPTLAILAAVLFGFSTPLAKLVLGEMSPLLLASLLYLGSGLGLHLLLWRQGQGLFAQLRTLSRKSQLKLAGAILSGGIIAPTLLIYGLRSGTAFETSLLLNFETIATTLIAWLIFKENVGRNILGGKTLILAGSILVATQGEWRVSFSAFLILATCFFWGIDTNLSRDLEDLSPSALTCCKGWVAGGFNFILAMLTGLGSVSAGQVGFSLLLGAFSYGISLVFFVRSLRVIGAARTGIYFSTGPFIGMALSVILLGEHPLLIHWIAGFLTLGGVWILSREEHCHSHEHPVLTHQHLHVHEEHDEHHQHEHEHEHLAELPLGPHDHLHTHQALTHTHAHYPDIHHRHHLA